jgi:pyridoxal phosphate enzyme (YggS family)
MIKENLAKINASLADGVRLIAVSKTKPVEDLREAYDAGQRLFGENKALEMRDKHAVLPEDIEWHFIGHLQTNKIKYIAAYVRMIHSIDSLYLLECVDKEAKKHDRVIDCLLQFHIATEETKFGLNMEEATALLESPEYAAMEHVRIVGVMGMATNTDNRDLVRREFRTLREYRDILSEKYFKGHDEFKEISMGMTHDYDIAMEEGSTLVRIGSAIFGARDYGVQVNDV